MLQQEIINVIIFVFASQQLILSNLAIQVTLV